MYDTNGLSGTGAGGLEGIAFDAPMDFCDLVYMETMMAVAEIDRALVEQMQVIREIAKKKKEISEKIKRLRDALEKSKAKDPDDLVYVEGGLDNPKDVSDSKFSADLDTQYKLQKALKDNYIEPFEMADLGAEVFSKLLSIAKNAGIPPDVFCESGMKLSDEQLESMGFFRKSAVENKIENLRSELEQLGGDQQLQLLNIQRLMNARSQRIQLASSVENKSNQTSMSVISNIGK